MDEKIKRVFTLKSDKPIYTSIKQEVEDYILSRLPEYDREKIRDCYIQDILKEAVDKNIITFSSTEFSEKSCNKNFLISITREKDEETTEKLDANAENFVVKIIEVDIVEQKIER